MSLRIHCLVLLVLAPMGCGAQTAIRSFEIATPRPYGYVIGDVFRQRITLELNAPFRLQHDALPDPGRIDRWLTLRDPRLEVATHPGFTEYRLSLSYQVLSAPPGLRHLYAPELALAYSDGEQLLHFPVPGFAYTVAPLIPAQDLTPGAALALRPARPPPPIPLAPHLWALALIGAGLGALGLFLAYLYWVVPFVGRSHGPFALACRELRACRRQPPGAIRDRAALRVLHRAFDRSAGRALFREDLDGFFKGHPCFAPARGTIEALFEASRGVFFDPARSDIVPPLAQVLDLCRRCRDLERGLR